MGWIRDLFLSFGGLGRGVEAVRKIEVPTEPVPETDQKSVVANQHAVRAAHFHRLTKDRRPVLREWNEAEIPKLVAEMRHQRSCGLDDNTILDQYIATDEFLKNAAKLLKSLPEQICNRCDARMVSGEPEGGRERYEQKKLLGKAVYCPDCGRDLLFGVTPIDPPKPEPKPVRFSRDYFRLKSGRTIFAEADNGLTWQVNDPHTGAVFEVPVSEVECNVNDDGRYDCDDYSRDFRSYQ